MRIETNAQRQRRAEEEALFTSNGPTSAAASQVRTEKNSPLIKQKRQRRLSTLSAMAAESQSKLSEAVRRRLPFISMRLTIVLLLMFGWFCVMSMRFNLGMAMVCMVNASAFSPQISSSHNYRNLTTNLGGFDSRSDEPVCVRDYDHNSDDKDDVGYHGDLLWSPSMQSTLFSATFYGGVVTMIPAGYISDRFGSKAIILIALMDSCLVTLLTPFLVSIDYYAYLIARIFMGLGEGFVPSAMSSLASYWIPASERSAMAALYTSGNQLAGCVGVLISSRLCSATAIGGWKSIFYIFGSLGVMWAVVWWLFASDTPHENRWISEKECHYLQVNIKRVNKKQQLSPKSVPWVKILLAPCMLVTYFNQFAFNFQVTMMQSYLPTYFRDVVLLDLNSNGFYTAMPFLMTLIFKNIAGRCSDKLKKDKILSTTNACKAFQCVATFGSGATLIALATLVDCRTPKLAFLILALTGICLSTAVVGYFTSQLSVAPCYTGIIVSVGMLAGTLASIASPNIIGKVILNYGTPEEWQIVFYVCAVLQIVSGVLFLIFGTAEEQPWATQKTDQTTGDDSVTRESFSTFANPVQGGDLSLSKVKPEASLISSH